MVMGTGVWKVVEAVARDEKAESAIAGGGC